MVLFFDNWSEFTSIAITVSLYLTVLFVINALMLHTVYQSVQLREYLTFEVFSLGIIATFIWVIAAIRHVTGIDIGKWFMTTLERYTTHTTQHQRRSLAERTTQYTMCMVFVGVHCAIIGYLLIPAPPHMRVSIAVADTTCGDDAKCKDTYSVPTLTIHPVTSATAVSPTQSWQSGVSTASHAPQAGEICWGQQIGKLVNTQYSYIVQFRTATTALPIRNGACELAGRTLTQIEHDIKAQYPAIAAWIVVADYTSAQAMPEQVNWQSGNGERMHTVVAGEICWGTVVGQYRRANSAFIVHFNKDQSDVLIQEGACELYGRTFAQITHDIMAQYTSVTWVIVPDYSMH